MYTYLQLWFALKSDRRAVTALEYGLIAALIAGVIITAMAALGPKVVTTFTDIGNALTGASGKIPTP